VELILASTSPYRKRLLQRIGLRFRQASPRFDESSIPEDASISPEQRAKILARKKAESLHGESPGQWILGSDQVCALEDRILHKPGDAERNRAQLELLAGKEHRLLTAFCLICDDEVHEHLACTKLFMRKLSPLEIARYVEADRAFDCAGGYKLEERGITLMERIETEDPSAIEGLPLIALVSVLRSLGFELPA